MDEHGHQHTHEGVPYIGPPTLGPLDSFEPIMRQGRPRVYAAGERVPLDASSMRSVGPGSHIGIGMPINREGEVRGVPVVTLDEFLARSPEAIAGTLSVLCEPSFLAKFLGTSLGDRPPPTLAQRLRRRALARLDAAFQRIDRWRDRHGIGPDYPE